MMLPLNPDHHSNHRQWSFDDIDEQYRTAIELDREVEFYKRREEYLKGKKHYEQLKKATSEEELTEAKVEENYWEILAPHGWKIRKEPLLECRLSCMFCNEIYYTIQGSGLREDSMWDVARKGVRKVKQHKCKALLEGEADEQL